jgi:hypothetical protein
VPTYAPQQNGSLFDHLVGKYEEIVRHFEAERPSNREIYDELTELSRWLRLEGH